MEKKSGKLFKNEASYSQVCNEVGTCHILNYVKYLSVGSILLIYLIYILYTIYGTFFFFCII